MRWGLRFERWRLILALIYLASMAVLIFKMASPVNIQIIVQGEQVYVREVSNVYTFTDMFIITVSAVVMASSGLSLVLAGRMTLEAKPGSPVSMTKTLSGNEVKIYNLIRESGGVAFQSEIVEALNLSKSTASITLDRLEAKGLIERRKRGMSNIIVAKHERPNR